MTYQYLIFDLDDTLFDFKGGEDAGLKTALQDFGLSDAELDQFLVTYDQVNQGLWRAFEDGEISRHDIFKRRFPDTLEEMKMDAADGKMLEERYYAQLVKNFRLLPHAKELLDALQGQHTLIAGTNGQTDMQKSRLAGTGLDQYFDQVYISDEIGVGKPDPAFFEHIFAQNPDMTRENTVMIGDGVNSDMQGAQKAGLDRIWFNDKQAKLPDNISVTQEVNHLLDIEKYV
ncbi:YjjG family noncanonical pyrimidine nucleotidase [Eupransor demetentiae]|uniref:HAD superfamily (Riboflavin biosynthesis) (YigB) n=1 Tax=Eupransor demetentiae TaxID=3109584 RepID=A0ABM9N3Z5_9LACO|nr:FMN and 5-amino-6-(5-phospho-D-ribitylamino)uracil phosphatase YigB [Lactobacillaceae bacterium LMG 33000]